ncbi:thioesterase [Streptomyces armeniacus]|uniref:Thioesterase n=1 Tax=Streptomyces armeniacus TaxID=83291 RepID=A0A345XVJ7_9ACTN|nr:thioesterase domain-containing protein [Streptomyces armeniacus]AXK35663.1 thioesterase [Streptomyces armeniacus]
MGTGTRGSSAGLVAESSALWRARRTHCGHRLICFPHAGGGASAYADWAFGLPDGIEVTAVQLPGRQNRVDEDFPTRVPPLVRSMTQALRPLLTGPFSFFGHSCGALLAHAVAQALRARGLPQPAHLFLSAQAAPEEIGKGPKMHELSAAEFRAAVLRLGGFEAEIADDEDAMEALLPSVLADFRLWEQHRISPVPRVDSPITAMVGMDDSRVSVESVQGWRTYTSARFETLVYPGGHFYFSDEQTSAELYEFLGRTLLA